MLIKVNHMYLALVKTYDVKVDHMYLALGKNHEAKIAPHC